LALAGRNARAFRDQGRNVKTQAARPELFSIAVFMASIAIPSVLTIALARNAVLLLYGAYVLVMPTWLLSFGLLYLDVFAVFYGRHR
jgi:hypothetical protein